MAAGTSIASARRLLHVDHVGIGLSAAAAAMLVVALAFVGHRLSVPSDGTEIPAIGSSYRAGGVTVAAPAADRGAATPASGDRIVAVFGRPMEDWAAALLDPGVHRSTLGVGDTVTYDLERDGRPAAVTVTAARFDAVAALAEDWGVIVLALVMQVVGIYLFVRRPHEPAAQALLITGTGMFASTIPWSLGLQVTDIAGASGFWLYALTAGLAYSLFWSGVVHFALVFPRPLPIASRGRRLLTIAYVLPIGAQLAFVAVTAVMDGRALGTLRAWMDSQAILQVLAVIVAAVLLVASYRRSSDPLSRLQLRWVAAAAVFVGIGSLVLWFGPQLAIGEPLVPRSAAALMGLPFPIALALAISRHHLFDLDAILNRSLVYAGLTAGVVLTYAMTVALVGGLIPGNAPFAVALLAAGAVGVVALPLHARLQRSVNRLMFGDRDDPEGALRRLGRRLEASLDPQTVLPTLVEAVADALRVPYVAVELERDGEWHIEAAHGTIPMDARGERAIVHLPIVYRGERVGRFVLSLRAPGEPFSRADEQLLADLARQAAPAIEAARLTADLRRSRMALVATREEERRRLRRDLHDGLGPTLAGSLMKLGAARSVIASDPARASVLLEGLESDTRGMIDDIRRIARNLRPPALDELGLVEVLRQHVAAFDGAAVTEGPSDRRLRVSLDAADALPALPAAVEVAGLRIALEGLTNVARHSGASQACVSLAMDGDALVVSVTDDGTGVAEAATPGVGLTSMRERADELGGTLLLFPAEGGGTTVRARLPVDPAASR